MYAEIFKIDIKYIDNNHAKNNKFSSIVQHFFKQLHSKGYLNLESVINYYAKSVIDIWLIVLLKEHAHTPAVDMKMLEEISATAVGS